MQAGDRSASGIMSLLLESARKIEVNLEGGVVSQSYDGASVMSGHKSGLQALVNSHLERLIIYIHCFCHRLALVVKDALNSIPFMHEHYSMVSSLYNHFKLKDISDLYDGNTLKRLIETRWSGHLATIKAIDNDLQNVINCLCTSTDRSVEVQHRAISLGLYHQICNSSFILFNKILKEILEILNIANLTFQSKGSNITAHMEIVNGCQREIDNISSVYNTDKICQDLQFLTIYYINHVKRPGRDRNVPSVLQKCIADTHLPSDVSGNDSLHDASSRLRQVVVALKICF